MHIVERDIRKKYRYSNLSYVFDVYMECEYRANLTQEEYDGLLPGEFRFDYESWGRRLGFTKKQMERAIKELTTKNVVIIQIVKGNKGTSSKYFLARFNEKFEENNKENNEENNGRTINVENTGFGDDTGEQKEQYKENEKAHSSRYNNLDIISNNNIYSPLDSENYIEEVNKKLEEDLIKKITSTYDKALVMSEFKKLKDKNLVGIDLLQELERNLKASKKEKCSNEVKEIFEYWNSKNIIKHKAMSNEIKKAIEKSLKVRSKDEIVQAIEIYSEILNSDFYFNHKWSLRDFLNRKNGISTFIEEGSNKSNYEEWKKGLKLKDKIGSKEKKEIKLRGWD